jgi:RND superfamily putative drug exporter
VIIAQRDTGLTDNDKDFLDDDTDDDGAPRHPDKPQAELKEHLVKIMAADKAASERTGLPRIISQIRSFRDLDVGDLLQSHDGKAVLMLVEMTTEFMDSRNKPTVKAIETFLKDPIFSKHIPAGLNISLSGEATVGRDMLDAARNSAKATEWLTLILVIFLLAAIYRAPFMAIIPLTTVIVSVKLTMSLLILCATQKWIVLFQGIETYVAVLMYGAGVDYCLFLIARYKEEIDSGATYDEAAANCVAKVGAAIAASAGTVICGIGMMVFAEFGKFHEAGIAISFGLTVVLIASLTFTPAMLRLSGKWAFWPQMRTERVSGGWISSSSLWSRLSEIHWLQNTWDTVGRALLKRPLTIWVIAVVLMIPFSIVGIVFYTHLSYGLLSDLSTNSPSVRGTHVVRAHYPAGATGSITVLIQNDNIDFSDQAGIDLIDQLTDSLANKKKDLQIADIRSVAHPQGEGKRLMDVPAGLRRKKIMEKALEFYVSTGEMDHHVTRLEITAEVDPFVRESMQHLTRLESEVHRDLPKELQAGTNVLISGSAASIRDLKAVTDRDQIRIDLLVVVSVFFILALLLRKMALCTYLILTVLFSYLVALGATYAFFSITDPQFAGLDWKVPMFLFTILIAVGEDYNIFLMTRIEEEQLQYGPVKGVVEALSKTGRIISSCGIIMAGTFASLCAGSLKGMVQLGFALAFGVMLDTFVVRPVLVPAYMVLLHSGRFGKFGVVLGGPNPESIAASNSPTSPTSSS